MNKDIEQYKKTMESRFPGNLNAQYEHTLERMNESFKIQLDLNASIAILRANSAQKEYELNQEILQLKTSSSAALKQEMLESVLLEVQQEREEAQAQYEKIIREDALRAVAAKVKNDSNEASARYKSKYTKPKTSNQASTEK